MQNRSVHFLTTPFTSVVYGQKIIEIRFLDIWEDGFSSNLGFLSTVVMGCYMYHKI
jgi:hypothetical protein